MPAGLHVTGAGAAANFEKLLRRNLRSPAITAVGMGVAYVSIYGASQLRNFCAANVQTLRMVVDIGDAITHPSALELGLEAAWEIRVVNPNTGTFHPKLIVGGTAFGEDDLLADPRLLIVGSANLRWIN